MKKIFISTLLLLTFISCRMPSITTVGTIDLLLSNGVSRTIHPDISMDVDSYQVRGTGSTGGSFTLDTINENNLIENIREGDWDLVVDAYNADGHTIGRGTGTTTVVQGETVDININVLPLDGQGELSLSMIWETVDVSDPVITANLLPTEGETIPMEFSETTPGLASASRSLDAGYYTLVLQLKDTDKVVMGTAETVRIAADQSTTGDFDFSDVNSIDGSVDIEIQIDMKPPIEISLTGTEEILAFGGSFTATAASILETETVIYHWYLNGLSLGTGASMNVGSDLDPGIYRLDIIALNADFSRSGSINHSFTVNEP